MEKTWVIKDADQHFYRMGVKRATEGMPFVDRESCPGIYLFAALLGGRPELQRAADQGGVVPGRHARFRRVRRYFVPVRPRNPGFAEGVPSSFCRCFSFWRDAVFFRPFVLDL